MDHKARDKVLVKADVINNSQFGQCRIVVKSSEEEEEIIWINDEFIEDVTAEEVWDLVFNVYSMDDEQIKDIFDVNTGLWGVLNNYTAHEAKARLDEWNKEKEINVGDVFTHQYDSSLKCVVSNVCVDNVHYIRYDGSCNNCSKDKFQKTHIKTNEKVDVVTFLKQINK